MREHGGCGGGDCQAGSGVSGRTVFRRADARRLARELRPVAHPADALAAQRGLVPARARARLRAAGLRHVAAARRAGHALGPGRGASMIKALLLLLKFAKFGPLLKSAGFMLLSLRCYALLFGWWYALGFVLLLLIHEMGHYGVARRLG